MSDTEQRPLSGALRSGSELTADVRPGLRALSKTDRGHIAPPIRNRFNESLALDEATRESHPDEHRWDYLLGISDTGEVIGLEVHPATTGEVQAVIAKKRAGQGVLKLELERGTRISAWYWAASGKTRFVPMEAATLALAKAGILFVGSRLEARHLPK